MVSLSRMYLRQLRDAGYNCFSTVFSLFGSSCIHRFEQGLHSARPETSEGRLWRKGRHLAPLLLSYSFGATRTESGLLVPFALVADRTSSR